jgi:hypothetical protein
MGRSRFDGRPAARRWSSMRQRRLEGDILTAIGKAFVAVLSSDQRGPLVTRRSKTKSDAYSMAHRLLDDAQDMVWFNGELVRIEMSQAEE